MCLQVVLGALLDFSHFAVDVWNSQLVVVPIFSTLVWIPEIPLWLCFQGAFGWT